MIGDSTTCDQCRNYIHWGPGADGRGEAPKPDGS